MDVNYPGIVLIPAREGGKAPKYKFKNGNYTKEMFTSVGYKECNNGCLMILTEDIIVIDVDDKDTCDHLEEVVPELRQTVACETSKGRHYYFTSTEYSKQNHMKDGARQMKKNTGEAFPIDIKTNGGMISIPPSPNKTWVKSPLDDQILPIPDSLVDFYVKASDNKVLYNNKTTPNNPTDRHVPQDISDTINLVKLLNPERATNYTDWIQLGWCLHNIGVSASEYLQIWDDFSKLSEEKYKPGECDRLWGSMRNEGLNIGSLHMWAKTDNPRKYKEYQNDSIFLDIKTCNGSHYSIAKIAYKLYHKTHVCVSANGRTWYYFNGSLWEEDEYGMKIRGELSSNLCDQFLLTLNKLRENDRGTGSTSSTNSEDTVKKLLSISYKLEDSGFKDNVMKEMKCLFYDKTFLQKLDSNPNYIAFNNGLYNLKEQSFRATTPEDYVSLSVNYDYTPETDPAITETIKRYFATLHPNKEQRVYLLQTLSRQLYGDNGNELFHIHAGHKGSAGNGKSKFFEIMELVLGDYIQKFAVEQLVVKQRGDPHRPTPLFHFWKGRRILYCSEPNADEKLNSGVMKELTGGEKITYRLLNCSETLTLHPMYKMHIMCNDAPQIDGSDQGVRRRIRKIDYMARFVDKEEVNEELHMYQKDLGFMEKFKTDPSYRMGMFRYIISYYNHEFRYEMPDIIKENSSAYLDENNKVLQFINEYVQRDEQTFFTLKDAKEYFKKSECFDVKINLKTSLEKALKTSCIEDKKISGRKYRSVFMGFRLEEPVDYLEG